MNTRTFILAAFVLAASFGTPFLANADTSCTVTDTSGKVVTGMLVNGVCSVAPAAGAGTPIGVPPGGTVPAPIGVPPPANTGTVVTLMNPLGNNTCSSNGTCLSSFLTSILKLVIQIGAVIVVLMLVYVGFLFVVAQGKPAEIEKAKSALLWTVIGALVLLGAQAIASGIQATIQALGG